MSRRLSNNGIPEDIGNLASDSFSDVPSDDSGSAWMQKIDVSNFKELYSSEHPDQMKQEQQDTQSADVDTAELRVSSTSSSSSTEEQLLLKTDQLLLLSNADETRQPSPVSWDHGSYVSNGVISGGGNNTMLGSRAVVVDRTMFPSPDSQTMLSPTVNDKRPNTSTAREIGAQNQRPSTTLATAPSAVGRSARSSLFHNDHYRPTPSQNAMAPMRDVLPAEVVTGRGHPKPIYSYSCLIALALKNSKTGRLTVAEIYNFMCENFPYFRTAPQGWKNSVRHNLSLNKCFEKIELEAPGGHGRKSCLWTLNPNKLHKMDQEIKKWREKDPGGVREALTNPDELEAIEKGLKGMPSEGAGGAYYLHTIAAEGPSQLLLVRSSQLPQLGYSHYASANGGALDGSASQQTWRSSKLQRLSIKPGYRQNATPPPPRHHPYQSASSPFNSAAAFTPPAQRHHGAVVLTPSGVHNGGGGFAQTPPYSPNIYSPQRHQPQTTTGDWTSSTPRYDSVYHQYSPQALSKITGGDVPHTTQALYAGADQFSPCKGGLPLGVMGQPTMCSYDAANSALNNNSLLQTALSQSPYKFIDNHHQTQPSGVVTLQRL